MFAHHKAEWININKQEDWLGMESLFASKFTPNSKAIYKFVWCSNEYFGDNNISIQRLRIRRIIWELPLFFVIIISMTLLLIITGILR